MTIDNSLLDCFHCNATDKPLLENFYSSSTYLPQDMTSTPTRSWRHLPELNRCTRFCRPLRNHSAKVPKRVDIIPYQVGNIEIYLKIGYYYAVRTFCFDEAP